MNQQEGRRGDPISELGLTPSEDTQKRDELYMALFEAAKNFCEFLSDRRREAGADDADFIAMTMGREVGLEIDGFVGCVGNDHTFLQGIHAILDNLRDAETLLEISRMAAEIAATKPRY